jgi:hypothetical protein
MTNQTPPGEGRKTDTQLIREANELARLLYRRMGYQVKAGYRFDRATHPQESACWSMVVTAYDHIAGTDLENALAEEGEA